MLNTTGTVKKKSLNSQLQRFTEREGGGRMVNLHVSKGRRRKKKTVQCSGDTFRTLGTPLGLKPFHQHLNQIRKKDKRQN